jgi:hypothetical protein
MATKTTRKKPASKKKPAARKSAAKTSAKRAGKAPASTPHWAKAVRYTSRSSTA